MQIILLSGGSGKRLWPLSNNTRSKQFIKLLTAPDGSKESMVQRVVRQLRETGICDSITVAGKTHYTFSFIFYTFILHEYRLFILLIRYLSFIYNII